VENKKGDTDTYEMRLWLSELSQPIIYDQCKSTYTKGYLFRVVFWSKNHMKWMVHSYNLLKDYWRHEEPYNIGTNQREA